MNIKAIFNVIGVLLVLLSVLLLLPLGVSLAMHQPPLPSNMNETNAFTFTLVAALGFGLALWRFLPPGLEKLRDREGFAIVAFSWIVVSLFGALPYWLTGVCTHFIDAFFESMSGFTTTGASILVDIESSPKGILFWRSMTQWIGGMGIIVLSLAIFPALGVGSTSLFRAEIPGGATVEKVRPRLAETAKILWKTYVVLTCIEILFLKWAGMSFFDAVCHSFSTLSTGGFSTYNASVGYFDNPRIELIIVLFMFFSGVNFALHHQLILKNFRTVISNPEFRLYTSLVCMGTLLIAWELIRTSTESNPQNAFRQAFFTFVSINTTTGFVTADYDQWPGFIRILLLGIMMVGGCSGSTSGSIKIIRYLILFKIAMRELYKLVHPRAIFHIKVGERSITPDEQTNVIALTFWFTGLSALAYIILSFMNVDLTTGVSASIATFSNTGPGLGAVGPTGNYADLPSLGKITLIGTMLLGRLEIYGVLLLLLPFTWRK